MTGVLHSHCSYCGAAYPAEADWPRVCVSCGETTWRNPLPVAVAVQPVEMTDGGTGVVLVRRAIEPGRGQLALPGGFIEHAEDWREAVVRELREETGLVGSARQVRLYAVHSVPTASRIVIFGVLPARRAELLPASAPTEEATEWLVVTEPTELAFSTHTEVLTDFLTSGGTD